MEVGLFGGSIAIMRGEIVMNANVKKNLITITIVSTLGGLLFGYDTGVINGALPYMAEPSQLNLTPVTMGLVASSLLFGAAIGAVAGGRISDKYGRRTTILLLAFLFFVGAVGCTLAPSSQVMIGFRFVLGLAVGGASVTVPSYLVEMSPVVGRGRMVTQNELMIVTGQFLAFFMNAVIAVVYGENDHVWRYMLVIAALPAIFLFFGMLRMPESPRWLATQGKFDEALQVLKKVRDENVAVDELNEIKENLSTEAHMSKATYKDLAQPWIRRIVLMGILLAVAQQITGVNTIMYYGSQILQTAGFSKQAALIGNIANGAISIAATFIGIWLLGKMGRRTLLSGGQLGCIVALCLLGIIPVMLEGTEILPYAVLSLTVMFLFFMQGAIAPTVWLMVSEIFPSRLRGLGMGICVFVLWITNFFVGLTFPVLLAHAGLSKTFLGFAIINVVAFVLVRKFIPETRGLSLEQLEKRFRNYKIENLMEHPYEIKG